MEEWDFDEQVGKADQSKIGDRSENLFAGKLREFQSCGGPAANDQGEKDQDD